MIKTKQMNAKKLSTSATRKTINSQYWRERTQLIEKIDENVTMFISQTDIKIIKLEESKKIEKSFSTIISSKGKIIID